MTRLGLLCPICLLLLTACEEREENGIETADSVESTTMEPVGRTRLPTWGSPAPDLYMTIPTGYSIRSDSSLAIDYLFIYRKSSEQLSLEDGLSASTLRIVVGDSLIEMRPPGISSGSVNRVIGHYPGVWESYRYSKSVGSTYFSHVMDATDYFDRFRRENGQAIYLHLFVSGFDSVEVNRLMEATSTLSVTP